MLARLTRIGIGLRNATYMLRIRFAGDWERVSLYEHWLGGFGSRKGAVRITGRPDFGSEPWLLHFGEHITITDGVRFLTHDGAVAVFRAQHPGLRVYGTITVGDNVFIGVDSLILPNVRIGDNCVIAAGSVVTKDVVSGTVVGGNPAKVIKTIDEYHRGVTLKSTSVTPSHIDYPPQRESSA